jgi:hypothetical protein
VLAQPAAAHVDVRPGLVEQGRVTELRVELPRLRPGPAPLRLEVEARGIDVLSARLQGLRGVETAWRVRIRAEAEPGAVPLLLRAVYADGKSVEVHSRVVVVPAEEASSFPWFPVVAGALAAVALGSAGLLVARRRA